MKSYSLKLIVALYLILPLHCLLAAEDQLRVVRDSGSDAIDIQVVDGQNFVDLAELSAVVGGITGWSGKGNVIFWELDGRRFTFRDRMAVFGFDNSVWQMVAPSVIDGRAFLVHMQVLTEFLPKFYPERFSYDKLDRVFRDRSKKVEMLEPDNVSSTKGPPVFSDANSYRIRTVVIDPGHGGKDPGTVGRKVRKLYEKNIVLDISREVANLLRKRIDLKVVLTRDNDTFIPLRDRGKIANESGAGLFVSIHVNASKSRNVRGSSTYFLDAAKTNEERATAMLENSSLKYEVEDFNQESLDDVNLILQDMAQNEYLRESQELSAFIQQELVGKAGLPDKGVRQANFAVLRGAFMPAALVETAFISNPKDESLLNTKEFRKKTARAIADGINAYIEHYHRKLAAGE